MLDLTLIRKNPDDVDKALVKRGYEPMAQAILDLDNARRSAVAQSQDFQTRRNEVSKFIGQAKEKGDVVAPEKLMQEVSILKDNLKKMEKQERLVSLALKDALSAIPNIPMKDVPEGMDESCHLEMKRFGSPEKSKVSRPHFEIGEALGLMDFKKATMLSGKRFTVLYGQLAQLERAISNFMLDIHTQEFGYIEISPPLLVQDAALFGTGQLPKFKEDLFRTEEGYWLIPTGEVPLVNLVREQIISAETLPLRFTASTPCFRSEAGAAGKDTRGMIRQHQFSKVELVSIVEPQNSEQELERMLHCAETILQRLNLPYRVVMLCAGDMGFSACKTYDIEVWLPGQDTYREISSCSICGDFQARRMQAKLRYQGDKQTHFLHTLNGSGLAVGRSLVAILENYFEEDGRVAIPEILQPYMNSATHIIAHG